MAWRDREQETTTTAKNVAALDGTRNSGYVLRVRRRTTSSSRTSPSALASAISTIFFWRVPPATNNGGVGRSSDGFAPPCFAHRSSGPTDTPSASRCCRHRPNASSSGIVVVVIVVVVFVVFGTSAECKYRKPSFNMWWDAPLLCRLGASISHQ